MQKISFDDWKNSMSFLIDDEFDQNFLGSIDPLVTLIVESCDSFANEEELERFLTTSNRVADAHKRLQAFIALIGLSEERLKRIVSLIRYRHYNVNFNTEWNVQRISAEFCNNQEFRNLLIEFFINGRDSEVGRDVPLYYMKNFKLTRPEFIDQLRNVAFVERILTDHEVERKYSNSVGMHVEDLIEKKLHEYKSTIDNSLTYERQKELPLLNKNIDFLIPSVDNSRILIESSYNITTGSGQSKRADQLVDIYSVIMKHNANHRDKNITMINFCDGFGWVGRQNDLRRIYDASDFVINHANLNQLDDILFDIYS